MMAYCGNSVLTTSCSAAINNLIPLIPGTTTFRGFISIEIDILDILGYINLFKTSEINIINAKSEK